MKRFYCLLLVFLCCSAFAADNNFVNGGGVLNKGRAAFSLDFGGDYGEPVLYGVRGDFGVADRFQIGFGGTFLGVAASGTIINKYNFLKSQSDKNFLTFQFSPALSGGTHIDTLLSLSSLLIYEHQWKSKKTWGLFFKAGDVSEYAWSRASYGFNTSPYDNWLNLLKIGAGFQVQTGKRFALTVEAASVSRYNFNMIGVLAKVGLTWGNKAPAKM